MNAAELEYQLCCQDLTARVLFVEGNTDLRFWSLLVPMAQRTNVLIYRIDEVEVLGGEDGARGRALRLAAEFAQSQAADRIKFFIDADSDTLLNRILPENIMVTDFRDLEAYVYEINTVRQMLFSCNLDPDLAATTFDTIGRIIRSCGILRLLDAKHDLGLPFQKTWNKGIAKLIEGADGNAGLNVGRALTALLQNSERSVAELNDILDKYKNIDQEWNDTSTTLIGHGKDLISTFAWRFQLSKSEAERVTLLALAFSIDRIRKLPNLNLAEKFARL